MYHRASLAKPVKPQTNLIFLSILSGRLDLTRFSILCGGESLLAAICLLIRLCKFTLLLYIAFSTKATYLRL